VPPLLEVGLTGGIAAGKSQVLGCLAEAGCHTLDLDHVAHEVMAPGGGAFDAVVGGFGREILDGKGRIDRAKLGRIVFADEAARRRLGSLVHPKVRDEERRLAGALAAGPGGVLVVDAALLVETGRHLHFDRLVVVDVDPDEQLRRLRARDRLSESAARLRVGAQMPVTEKRRYAHRVIDSSGELSATRSAARRLAQELQELARNPPRRPDLEPERMAAALAAGPDQGTLPPVAYLESVSSHGGLELEELNRVRRPGSERPWYAADGGDPIEALALAVPTAIWVLCQRGEDRAYLAGAAFSLGRLCGVDGDATASLVLLTLAAAGAAVERDLAAAWRDHHLAWQSETERWCQRPVPVPAPLRAALAHPTAPAGARAALGASGGTLAAALVSLATGISDQPVGEAVRRTAAAVIRPRR
jgi:dephospho-CoA kinase